MDIIERIDFLLAEEPWTAEDEVEPSEETIKRSKYIFEDIKNVKRLDIGFTPCGMVHLAWRRNDISESLNVGTEKDQNSFIWHREGYIPTRNIFDDKTSKFLINSILLNNSYEKEIPENT